MKSSYCIFAVRPKNFHFSSLKEIENQPRMLKKVLAENYTARTFALPLKNGMANKAKRSLKVGKQQHVSDLIGTIKVSQAKYNSI